MKNDKIVLQKVKDEFEHNGVEVVMFDGYEFNDVNEYEVVILRVGVEYFYQSILELIVDRGLSKIGLSKAEYISISGNHTNLSFMICKIGENNGK